MKAKPATTTEFWILDPETKSESCPVDPRIQSMGAIGPFRSMHDAQQYLRDDGADTYMRADGSLRDLSDGSDWAAPVIIVQTVQRVQQVPVVSVSCKLKTIKP